MRKPFRLTLFLLLSTLMVVLGCGKDSKPPTVNGWDSGEGTIPPYTYFYVAMTPNFRFHKKGASKVEFLNGRSYVGVVGIVDFNNFTPDFAKYLVQQACDKDVLSVEVTSSLGKFFIKWSGQYGAVFTPGSAQTEGPVFHEVSCYIL